jgi:hypothetical protein
MLERKGGRFWMCSKGDVVGGRVGGWGFERVG